MDEDYKISIKVKIGDRTYPMKVKPSEEQTIRKAALKVTSTYNNFAFRLIDPIDRMAHVAFSMALEQADKDYQKKIESSTNRLKELQKLLSSQEEK